MNQDMIYEFKPIRLTLDRIGPFQEQPYEVDFTDNESHPCNVYLLVSRNGFGKTTILESMATLMGLLDQESPREYGMEDLDRNEGRVQLDLYCRVFWEGKDHIIILSLLAGTIGEEVSLHAWDDPSLEENGADSWHRLSFRKRGPGLIEDGKSSSLLAEFIRT